MSARVRCESGQALLLVLGMVAVLLAATMILAAFGQALGGKSAAQRAVDLSAVSAASSMRADFPRLFLPPVLPNGAPNPRHMPLPVYLARARRAAVSGARRNGARLGLGDVTFPGVSFAPTSVAVRIRDSVRVAVDGPGSRRRRRVAVRAPRYRGAESANQRCSRLPGPRLRRRLRRPARLSDGQGDAPRPRRRVRPHGRGGAP